MDSATELDQLIDLLDQPASLQVRMDALRNSTTPLTDEVEGFIAYYDAYQGDTVRIKEKLALQEIKLLQPITTSSTHWFLNKWAAAITLILAGGITYMLLNKPAAKQDLQPYEEIGLPNYMSPSTATSIDWKVIMVDFKTHQFNKITALNNSTNNDTLTYFQGISAFQLKQFTTSKQLFNKLTPKSSYYNKSLYFKSLCYFEQNDLNQAKRLLQEIKFEKNDPSFNEKVKELKHLK